MNALPVSRHDSLRAREFWNVSTFAGGTAPPKGTRNLPPATPDTLSGDEIR